MEVKSIYKDRYKLNNHSKEDLKSLGFYYSSLLSDSELQIYTYKFPVLKYKNKTVLECELSIDTTYGEVKINVYDMKHELYIPFYHIECGNYDEILSKINKKIKSKLTKLGIKKVMKKRNKKRKNNE